MANLLQDPWLFRYGDENGWGQPPASNYDAAESLYLFDRVQGFGSRVTLYAPATPVPPGSTLSGRFLATELGQFGEPAILYVRDGDQWGNQHEVPILEVQGILGQEVEFSVDVSGLYSPSIATAFQTVVTPVGNYAGEAVVLVDPPAPPPDPPEVGDITATVQQDSQGNQIASLTVSGEVDTISLGTGPAHGSIEISGLTFIYTPTPGFAGVDAWTYTGTGPTGTSAPALATITVVPAPVAMICDELGRVTRAYVSGYDRGRVHQGRLRNQERRCVVADFNGAISRSREIVSAEWQCTHPYVANMLQADIQGAETRVTVNFQFAGCAALRAQITLDNGEVYNQLFEFKVDGAPWFEDAGPTTGPRKLVVTP